MHKYLSPLCKNILQIIITHSNKSSSQIPSGPKCWVLQDHQFLFWKITTWKHEELMRNFQYFFLSKLLQSETFSASTCILLQHLWSLATFNYAKRPRIHFPWSTGWRPTSMVQILTSNIVRGGNMQNWPEVRSLRQPSRGKGWTPRVNGIRNDLQ